jgi:acyl carrier protein
MTQGFTQETITSRIEEIIREQIGSDTVLSSETNLQEDLGMDSLEIVELGVALENAFDISVSNADVRRCATLDDVIQLVWRAERAQEAKSA